MKERNSKFKDRTFVIGLLLMVLAVIYVVLMAFATIGCWATWSGTEMESRSTSFGVCQIKTGQGWIPAANYRVN